MARLMFCKKGIYGGKTYIFSHRNPQTGDVWSDDIPNMQIINNKPVIVYGMWVPFDSVKWVV